MSPVGASRPTRQNLCRLERMTSNARDEHSDLVRSWTKVRRRAARRRHDPRRFAESVFDRAEIDGRIDERRRTTAVERRERIGPHFHRLAKAIAKFVSDVMRELKDEIGLSGHFTFLKTREIASR